MVGRLPGCTRIAVAAMVLVAALAARPAAAAVCLGKHGQLLCESNSARQVTTSNSAAYVPDANGVFRGDPGSLEDSAKILAEIIGFQPAPERDVLGLARSGDDSSERGSLTVTTSNGTEGDWLYMLKRPNPVTPTYLLVTAGDYFAIWVLGSVPYTGNYGYGTWTTAPIGLSSGGQATLTHLTALAVAPIPGAAFLLAPALLGLAGLRWRQRPAQPVGA